MKEVLHPDSINGNHIVSVFNALEMMDRQQRCADFSTWPSYTKQKAKKEEPGA